MTATAPARIADNKPYRATALSHHIKGTTPFESTPLGHERRLGDAPPNPSPQPHEDASEKEMMIHPDAALMTSRTDLQ